MHPTLRREVCQQPCPCGPPTQCFPTQSYQSLGHCLGYPSGDACFAHLALSRTCLSTLVVFVAFPLNSLQAGNGLNTGQSLPRRCPRSPCVLKPASTSISFQRNGIPPFEARPLISTTPFVQLPLLFCQRLCSPLPVLPRSRPLRFTFGQAVRQTTGGNWDLSNTGTCFGGAVSDTKFSLGHCRERDVPDYSRSHLVCKFANLLINPMEVPSSPSTRDDAALLCAVLCHSSNTGWVSLFVAVLRWRVHELFHQQSACCPERPPPDTSCGYAPTKWPWSLRPS